MSLDNSHNTDSKPLPKIPPWVRKLGAAVWISGPDRKIHYMNKRASDLLGVSEDDCQGKHCFRVVGGFDDKDLPFCGPNCPVSDLAQTDQEMAPVTFQVENSDGESRWIRVLTIPSTEGSNGPWLVHCAFDVDREYRTSRYLNKVASRNHPSKDVSQRSQFHELTRREREVLDLLAQDEDQKTIASKLGLSYATVRNHVQRIQNKLGVHSILEAVAVYLLKNARED